jgi:hypothetical protein
MKTECRVSGVEGREEPTPPFGHPSKEGMKRIHRRERKEHRD